MGGDWEVDACKEEGENKIIEVFEKTPEQGFNRGHCFFRGC